MDLVPSGDAQFLERFRRRPRMVRASPRGNEQLGPAHAPISSGEENHLAAVEANGRPGVRAGTVHFLDRCRRSKREVLEVDAHDVDVVWRRGVGSLEVQLCPLAGAALIVTLVTTKAGDEW